MVHAFTCAGVIPTQYIKMSLFAGIGSVKHAYAYHGYNCSYFFLCIVFTVLSVVYNQGGYIKIVQDMAERSMKDAVNEVKALESYSSGGKVQYTQMHNYRFNYDIPYSG